MDENTNPEQPGRPFLLKHIPGLREKYEEDQATAAGIAAGMVITKGQNVGKSESLMAGALPAEGSFPVEIQSMPSREELKAAFSKTRIQPIRPTSKHGKDRNKKCPCGSGKKYKHCHLREQEMNLQAAVRAQRELRTLAAAEVLKQYQQAKGLP